MADQYGIPALSPPAGTISDFDSPSPSTLRFILVSAICLPLAFLALGIRLATSLGGRQRQLHIEDYLCTVACLGLLTSFTLTTFDIRSGLGRHQWDIRLTDAKELWQLLFASRLIYSPTILSAKLTVLMQIHRIFVPPKTRRGAVYWLLQVVIGLNVGFYFAYFMSTIFQCTPVAKTWDKVLPGTCINSYVNVLVTGAVNVLSDVIIFFIPVWAIWHLRIPVKKKLRISAVFALGLIAISACAMRIVHSVTILGSPDVSYWYLYLRVWTIAEVSLTLLCASLPLIPQFINIIRRALGYPSQPASIRAYRRTGSSYGSGTTRSRPALETSSCSRLDGHEASWAELPLPPAARTGVVADSKSNLWALPESRKDLEQGPYGDLVAQASGAPNDGRSGITKTVEIEQSFRLNDKRGPAITPNLRSIQEWAGEANARPLR